MTDVRAWFEGMPLLTRHWFGLSVALPLASKIGLLPLQYVALTPDFLSRFHLWKPITALFSYPITRQTGFHFLTNLYFLYSYSLRLENDTFNGRTADYLFMLVFNWASIAILSYFMSIPLLMDSMVMSVMYVWCQLNKDMVVNFWFGTRFKAALLPWVLLGFNVVINGGGVLEIIGIIVGHLYYFLMFIYPDEYGGERYLETPSLFYSYFPSTAGRGGFIRMAPSTSSASQPRRTGYSWGSGNVLGSN